MKILPILVVSLFLMFGIGAHAEELMVTSQTVTLVPAPKPKLNSDKKAKLSFTVSRRAFNGSVGLPRDTLVKVKSRASFTTREEVRKRNSPTPEIIKRNFQAAFVEVMDGDKQGTTGWVVVTVQDKGSRATTYLRRAPSNFTANKASQASQSRALDSAPDLVPTVSRGDSRKQMAGKEIFSISIANQGGVATRGVFHVTVTVNGKKIKTEKVRKLGAKRSHYFNVEVSESAIRKHHTLIVTVDKANTVDEADEGNNVKTMRL